MTFFDKKKKKNKQTANPSMFKNFHNLKKLHIVDCGMENGRDANTATNDVVFSNEKFSFLPYFLFFIILLSWNINEEWLPLF